MFENTNKGLLVEIARETMKTHRLRNIMACLSVLITTTLITVITGGGIGTIDAIMTESGMSTQGLGVYGDREVLDKVRERPEVEWADIARPCMYGSPKNKEFGGTIVKFFAVDKEYYTHHNVELIEGGYPKNEREIIISDTMEEKLEGKAAPGKKIVLNLVLLKNGQQKQESVEFSISGIYDNPTERGSNEEIYTSEVFPDKYNPELQDESSIVYVKFTDHTMFTPIQDIMEDIKELNEAVSGNGIVMNMEGDLDGEILTTVVLLLLVIICGYLLIYNIFRISLVNDIQFIGNMKIIGMTGKQVQVVHSWQIRRIACIGILAGSAFGTGFNCFVIHLFRSMDFSYARFYDMGRAIGLGLIAGILFAVLTVAASSRMAVSLGKKVSPVTACKYRVSGRMKKVFAAVSYALGIALFCAVFTVFAGYDTEWAVDRMNESDYVIRQWHAMQCMDEPYEPMEEDFIQKIRDLDFVKDSYVFYRARSKKCDIGNKNLYNESEGEVKYDGRYKEVSEKERQKIGYIKEDWEIFVQEGRANTGIVGMEAGALNMEASNVDVWDGKLDAEQFATGGYLIYQPYVSLEDENDGYFEYGMKAGDKVTLSFWNSWEGKYYKKDFTVMAVVQRKKDNYAAEMTQGGIQLIISDKAFEEVYGASAKKMISALHLNTEGKNPKTEQDTIDNIVKDNFNLQVQVDSRYKAQINEGSEKNQRVLIGTVLGAMFALIGLINILNIMVTNVLSRKLEYATMQSIGMTRRQMAAGICRDGMKMILAGMIPGSIIGFWAANQISVFLYTKFVFSVYVLACALVFIAGLAVVMAAGIILTVKLNRKTIVERLREAG